MMFDDDLDTDASVANPAAPNIANSGDYDPSAADILPPLTAIAGSASGVTGADDKERDLEFSGAENDHASKGETGDESRDAGHPTSSGDTEAAHAPGSVDATDRGADRSDIIRLYNFDRNVDRKMEAYRRDGKNPLDLLDPSKPDYLGTPEALLPHFGPEVAAAAARNRAAQAADLDGIIRCFGKRTGQGLTPIPVHADDSAHARPPGLPVFPGSPEWEDMFVRGMQGLIHALRGRFGGSRNDGDDDFCYKRYDDEEARCLERSKQEIHRRTRGAAWSERRNVGTCALKTAEGHIPTNLPNGTLIATKRRG